MMTETEKFLEQYKRLESALRETNTADTVLDYENSLQTDPVNSDTYDKLKTCRIIRNYIQHHPDGAKMFPASSQMTEFIKKQADLIESKIQKASDIMTKQRAVTADMTLEQVWHIVGKSKFGYAAFTFDAGYYGVVTVHDVLDAICDTRSFDTKLWDAIPPETIRKKTLKEGIEIADPGDKAEDWLKSDSEHIVVVDQKNWKYKGIIR